MSGGQSLGEGGRACRGEGWAGVRGLASQEPWDSSVFPEAPGLLSRKGRDTHPCPGKALKSSAPEISKGLSEEGPVQLCLKATHRVS